MTPVWHHLLSCASTSDEAMRLGRQGAPHGTVVIADAQERGRGRLGRIWYSPPGENLYLSLLLRPRIDPRGAPMLTLCAGVAVADTLSVLVGPGARVEIKWPNDILLSAPARGVPPRKVAGILTEMATSGGRVDFVVVGVGLNLGTSEFPPALSGHATSLLLATGRRARPLEIAGPLVGRLLALVERLLRCGAQPILDAYMRRADSIRSEQQISVWSGNVLMKGRAVGLSPDGALLLRDPSGQVHAIVAGEVCPSPEHEPAEKEGAAVVK